VWGASCWRHIPGRALAGGEDEQEIVQARDPEDSGDGIVDPGEDQESLLSEQSLMRRHQDAETGAVEKRHLRQVEVDDPATPALLRSQSLGELVPSGQIQLAHGSDRRTQWTVIDDLQLVPRAGICGDGSDDGHDDAP
jgi:hypothetical protein